MPTDSTVEFLKQIARDARLAAELIEAPDRSAFLARAASIGERIGHVPDARRLEAAIDRGTPDGPEELEDASLEDIGGGVWSAAGLTSILREVRQGSV